MKKSKLLNIILITLTIIMLVTPAKAQAKTAVTKEMQLAISASEIFTQGGNWLQQGEEEYATANPIDSEAMTEAVGFLYGIFVGAGAVIAIIVGIILGIKFMMAASADDKAKYKQQLIIYAVGIVVIFGAYGIWKLVINTLNITT